MFTVSQWQGHARKHKCTQPNLIFISVCDLNVFALCLYLSALPFLNLCFPPLLFLSLCACVTISLPGRWWLQSDVTRLHSEAKHQHRQHRWAIPHSLLSCCKMNSSQSPDAGQYLAAAAKLDLCTDRCGEEPSICCFWFCGWQKKIPRPLLDEWKFYFLPLGVAQNGKQHEHISKDIDWLSYTQTVNSTDFIYAIYSIFTMVCLEDEICIYTNKPILISTTLYSLCYNVAFIFRFLAISIRSEPICPVCSTISLLFSCWCLTYLT